MRPCIKRVRCSYILQGMVCTATGVSEVKICCPFGSVIRMVLVLEYAAKLPNKKSLKALPEAAWCGQEEEIGDKYLDAQSDRLMDFWSAW
jgi:hypothetical protein